MITDPIFCPTCGHNLTEQDIGGRLRPKCDHCGYVHYLNPVPGVGLLIETEAGLVLIRRKNPPHQGEWTLPSGFVEINETAEEAAMREAEEETGLKVKIVELVAVNSFPEGPPSSGIIIFFRVVPIGGALQAGDDATEAQVFTPLNMPLIPFRTHREAVGLWLERQRNPLLHQTTDSGFVHEQDYIIREADSADLPELSAILKLIPHHRSLHGNVYWGEVAQRFREVDGLYVLVAQTRQHPPMLIGMVAFSVLRTLTEGIAFVSDLAVLPVYQRRGIGAVLIEAVRARAQKLGLHTLMVNADRLPFGVRAFFEAESFEALDMLVRPVDE